VQCQSRGFAECKTRITGGCKARCQEPEGALFCDGNYVDTGNRLKDCIDALNAYLNVKVQGSASGSCQGNQCQGEASGSISCAAAPGGGGATGTAALLGVGLVAIAAGIARRRQRAGTSRIDRDASL
jgi:hypothetical protein